MPEEIDQLILHECGHFYMSIQFKILPEFIIFHKSAGKRIGAVYTSLNKRLINDETALFYTIAGGMIAEVSILGEFKESRCKDDINQIQEKLGPFDEKEVFRMAKFIDKRDLMKLYDWVKRECNETDPIIGSDIILKSGLRSSFLVKIMAMKRKIIGGGYKNKKLALETVRKIREQKSFDTSALRD